MIKTLILGGFTLEEAMRIWFGKVAICHGELLS